MSLVCDFCNKPKGCWGGLLESQTCQCPDPKYQCCECKKEIPYEDYRVEVPEKNEVYCIECFYKNHKIIT